MQSCASSNAGNHKMMPDQHSCDYEIMLPFQPMLDFSMSKNCAKAKSKLARQRAAPRPKTSELEVQSSARAGWSLGSQASARSSAVPGPRPGLYNDVPSMHSLGRRTATCAGAGTAAAPAGRPAWLTRLDLRQNSARAARAAHRQIKAVGRHGEVVGEDV